MAEAENPLLIDEQGGVAWLTMNRPERLNALNRGLTDALRHYFQALEDRPEIRVVVLQGAGRAYCAGLDLKDRVGAAPADVQAGFDGQKSIRDIMIAMRECPQPIVSIVQGPASGGGLGIALASDIRLATPEARFNAAFIKIGVSGCDMGSSYFLPRMVGASVASEMLLTGRFLEAQRALALGLVSKVDSFAALQAEARALADEMLNATPLALRLTKDCLNQNIDAQGLRAAIAMEDRNQVLCTRGGDFQEGIRAFLEKRKPVYGQALS
ncbi:MAG: enoyl-CoA hydratase/isomerase family protein [Burkholderiaceae bacterium]|nr:enoyl-CoA hydratase/isomerase family protein [Burkholderiaceae bacterium]